MAGVVKASDRVYDTIREDILSGRLPSGTPLSEVELADRLGVSRTPLRAALSKLAAEGLVDTSQGRTGVVPEVSAASVAELFELREALEVHAARLAARRGDPAVFSTLASEFADARRVLRDKGRSDYYDVVSRFDEALDVAIDNRSLRAALDTSRLHLVRARRLASDNPERLLQAAVEHGAICRAIAAGDEALATSATIVHLRASLATILSTLQLRADRQGIA
ncbi:GntR family transcriptional regulator [Naasia lichenicola]|uniref:GntR family transcriptional regulator n=1 Tax=Naasia lichenicola TaxID=2565933 RepID=A0A4S4FIA8_9MICO|nr:GntR family transcriptional regulator [Naasia lichenicola]THG29572.1 GntR family transcriptional regulator [Naasia lichenicola]